MLSLFVVNADLAPAASRGEAAASSPVQGLGPDPPREPVWGALGFFFLPFFVWRVLLPFIFTVKCWRQTGQHGGEELVLPPPWHASPLLTLREALAAPLTPSHCPVLAASPVGLSIPSEGCGPVILLAWVPRGLRRLLPPTVAS